MNPFHRIALELKAIGFLAGAARVKAEEPREAAKLEAKATACAHLLEAYGPQRARVVFAPPGFIG